MHHAAAAIASASPRDQRSLPQPPHAHSSFRSPASARTAANRHSSLLSPAASTATNAATPLTAAHQQHLSDAVRVNGYLADRWLSEDCAIDRLLTDKQLTADSVAELRQQAMDEQWLDEWQPEQYHNSHHATPP